MAVRDPIQHSFLDMPAPKLAFRPLVYVRWWGIDIGAVRLSSQRLFEYEQFTCIILSTQSLGWTFTNEVKSSCSYTYSSPQISSRILYLRIITNFCLVLPHRVSRESGLRFMKGANPNMTFRYSDHRDWTVDLLLSSTFDGSSTFDWSSNVLLWLSHILSIIIVRWPMFLLLLACPMTFDVSAISAAVVKCLGPQIECWPNLAVNLIVVSAFAATISLYISFASSTIPAGYFSIRPCCSMFLSVGSGKRSIVWNLSPCKCSGVPILIIP